VNGGRPMRPLRIDVGACGSAPPGLRCLVLEVGCALVAVLTFRLDAGMSARRLTKAEEAVVRAIFEGKSNETIARARGTSPRTVANQIASIFRKHAVASRAELVAHYLVDVTRKSP
jgi:DNA-binding CsgD family transcriptional regulator